MKVKDLVELLKAMPQNQRVCIVYDSGACWSDVKDVRLVKSGSWQFKGKVVAILEDSAAEDMDRSEDP